MQDPEVLRQRAKVRLLPDEELGRLMPRRQSIVDITLVDGTTLHEHVDSVRGTAFNPMTSDEVRAKARDLMTPVLGQASTSKLIEQIFATRESDRYSRASAIASKGLEEPIASRHGSRSRDSRTLAIQLTMPLSCGTCRKLAQE